MNTNHWILLLLWVTYCTIHSVLANVQVKQRIELMLGFASKYYRLAYSIFATVSLALVLWYHFSISSVRLFNLPVVEYIVAALIGMPGLIIMAICIHKYFYELSGIQVFSKKEVVEVTLQQKGLHGYVRHPLYLGTLMFVWGLFVLMPYLNNLIACLVMNVYILIGIRLEEKQLLKEFGESYRIYAEKVPRLIPGLR